MTSLLSTTVRSYYNDVKSRIMTSTIGLGVSRTIMSQVELGISLDYDVTSGARYKFGL